MIVVFKYVVPYGFSGISIYPFIFLNHKALKDSPVFINHENIHLRQQIELLVIPFYIWYALEFLFRLFQHKQWKLAYCNISFEKEAYANEYNINYLDSRKFWAFMKYLKS